MLYVFDLTRKKSWQGKPVEVGHRRDFNRVEDPSVSDPMAIEKIFSRIESKVAPLLRTLFSQKRGPRNREELGLLVEFMAIQWIRVPAFRALVARTFRAKMFEEVLSTPERWEAALKKLGTSPDRVDVDYSGMVEAISSPEITFNAEPGFYLQQGANVLQDIGDSLKKMRWGWLVSDRGQFIGSDSPIAFDGEEGKPIGFGNADIITYPVNRYLLLYGTQVPIPPPDVTTNLIARYNTFAMLNADEQVYSHRPDFHWLNSQNKGQNDWSLFSREDFGASA